MNQIYFYRVFRPNCDFFHWADAFDCSGKWPANRSDYALASVFLLDLTADSWVKTNGNLTPNCQLRERERERAKLEFRAVCTQ